MTLTLLLGYLEPVQLTPPYQSLEVNRVNHLRDENEWTQTPMNVPEKGTEGIPQVSENELIQSTQPS